MSRSRKKIPISKDNFGGKKGKRLANHAVRRYKDNIPNGKWYRKIYNSYNINDYICYFPIEEVIDYWYEEESEHYKSYAWRHDRFKSLEEYIQYWKKHMIRK